MDLSYSLRLREGGVRRVDLLRDAVSSLVDARGIEWALLSFRDVGDLRVHVPFTEEPARIRAALPDLPDGRLSPIREGIGWAGEYAVGRARTKRRAVVLVSDGIGTGGTSFAAATGKGFADEGVALFVLGVDHKDNPPIRTALEAVALDTGGGYYTYRRVYDLSRALARFAAGRVGAAGAGRLTRLAQIDTGGARARPSRAAALPLDAILLGAGAAGLAVFALLRMKGSRTGSRRAAPRRKRLIMRLAIVHRDARVERLHFERPPVRVGAGKDARVSVPGAGKAGFSLDWDRENVWLEAAAPVIVNGVARTRKTLHANDRIALAGARIVFLGMLVREESDEAPAPSEGGPHAARGRFHGAGDCGSDCRGGARNVGGRGGCRGAAGGAPGAGAGAACSAAGDSRRPAGGDGAADGGCRPGGDAGGDRRRRRTRCATRRPGSRRRSPPPRRRRGPQPRRPRPPPAPARAPRRSRRSRGRCRRPRRRPRRWLSRCPRLPPRGSPPLSPPLPPRSAPRSPLPPRRAACRALPSSRSPQAERCPSSKLTSSSSTPTRTTRAWISRA